MSLFSDRRSLRQIGGLRAYVRQVAWSLWWRFDSQEPAEPRRPGRADAEPVLPPAAAGGRRPRSRSRRHAGRAGAPR